MAEPEQNNQQQGLGDAVEKVAQQLKIDKLMERLGIRKCGCKKRKDYLNKISGKK